MNLVSIRIITDDVARLVDFYEQVTGTTAVWGNEIFAELSTASGSPRRRGRSSPPER
jgi:catechol 2,3-dioxygenase-like lactoylglutathione lyase family enzyme